MQLTATAYFLIPYIIFIAFKKKERIFYNLIFFSALTSISIFNLGNGASSITAFQIISLVLFCRVLLSVLNGSLRVEKKFNKILFAFILICGMSIFLTPYKGEFIVLSPNDIYENVKFSLQNITQYFYLLLGYIVYFITYVLLCNNIVDVKKIIRVITITYIVIIVLCLLQLIIPVEIYNKFLRNTVYINDQTFLGHVRISATNIEASILILFMAPLTFAFLYVYKETLKIRYLILSISGLGICILSNSSSFYLALLIYIVIYMFFIKNSNSFTKKKLFIYILLIISFVCLIVLYKDIVLIGIQALTEKLQGQNSSGIARGTAFKTHINVFKENVMFGIGFGTTRSYDLFSSWLVQVGLLGFSLYMIFIIITIKNLQSKRSVITNFMCIVVTISNFIMLVSVSEYSYLYLWIYYGLSEYLNKVDFEGTNNKYIYDFKIKENK